jgi:chromosome segregation ATPase
MSWIKKSKLEELEKKIEGLQEQVINMASYVAEVDAKLEEARETLMVHQNALAGIDDHIKELFDDTADEVAKQWNKGLEQVINFNPYSKVMRNG